MRALLGATAAALLAFVVFTAGAFAATPVHVGSASVATIAAGISRPTSFAFGVGRVFVSGAGPGGGVFVLRDGSAVRVPGLPVTFGLAWKSGVLYGTSGTKLFAWSGWNGTRFTRTKVVFAGARGFPGLNGVALGPDGRLYLAVRLDEAFDHAADPARYAQSLLSLRVDGTDVEVVANGIRQPWEIAFAAGMRDPYVTVLGQDNLGSREPPDYLIHAKPGQSYGFPGCNWSNAAACAEAAKPSVLFPPHSNPMGIAAVGTSLYVALEAGTGRGSEVVAIPAAGGIPKPVLIGFPAPVRALGSSDGYLYAADLDGTVYRVRL